MSSIESIKNNFNENIQTKVAGIDTLPEIIADAGQMMVQALLNDHKILCCGNGGSAANAQHFSTNLLHRFESERPSLPAIALSTDTSTITSIANDQQYDNIFSHQIKALGKEGDVVLAISTTGLSRNILHAIKAAHQRHAQVIALTGNTGGDIAPLLSPNDIEIRTQAERPSRIYESHLLIIHCLCDIIDSTLFQTNY